MQDYGHYEFTQSDFVRHVGTHWKGFKLGFDVTIRLQSLLCLTLFVMYDYTVKFFKQCVSTYLFGCKVYPVWFCSSCGITLEGLQTRFRRDFSTLTFHISIQHVSAGM